MRSRLSLTRYLSASPNAVARSASLKRTSTTASPATGLVERVSAIAAAPENAGRTPSTFCAPSSPSASWASAAAIPPASIEASPVAIASAATDTPSPSRSPSATS